MEYLFNCWRSIKENLSDKNIMLFLDFDGTLTPIADRPDKAVMPKETRAVLDNLSKNPLCKIAIISGRSLADIKEKVGLKDIIYAGNHGLEIEGPKIKYKSPVSAKQKRILEKLKNELTEKLASFKGVILEDKGLSLSLHFRLVEEKDVFKVKEIFHQSIILSSGRNEIKIKPGKKVLEVRPQIEWDKGRAVLWILEQQQIGLAEEKNILPIFIGDDLTDEDAFLALENRGLTIFVGDPLEKIGRVSYAKYYLKDPDEVREFLYKCNNIFTMGEIKE